MHMRARAHTHTHVHTYVHQETMAAIHALPDVQGVMNFLADAAVVADAAAAAAAPAEEASPGMFGMLVNVIVYLLTSLHDGLKAAGVPGMLTYADVC